jgi:hypothetical protein
LTILITFGKNWGRRLRGEEYDYDVSKHVPWPLPSLQPEDAKEVEILVEEYMPPGFSKEQAIRLAMEHSELIELG